MFDPDTGACAGGPCHGKGLTPLVLEVQDDGVYCRGAAAPVTRKKATSDVRKKRAERRKQKKDIVSN